MPARADWTGGRTTAARAGATPSASRPSRTASSGASTPTSSPPPSRLGLGADRPPDDDHEVDHRDLEDDEHEDRFPDGDAHAQPSLTAASAHQLRTRVANTSLTLEPLGCPELPTLLDPPPSWETIRETHRPPRHRSVRPRRGRRAQPRWRRSGCGSGSTTIRASAGSPIVRNASQGSAQNNAIDHPPARPVEPRGEDAPGQRGGPVRSGVRVRRHRRGRQGGAGERPGSDPHDLRHAALGERRQEPERHAHAGRRLHQLLARDRVALLGPVRWDIRSCASGRSGTSRTSSSSSPRSSTRAAARSRRRTTRSSPQPRTPASRPGTRRPRSRSARRPPAAATRPTGLRPTHSPGKFAELVAKANPRLKFDAWSHHPYPSVPNSPPSQVVKWPNVSLASLPRFDENLKTLVQAQVGADLGHGVRPSDAAGGLARHPVRARRPRTSSSRSSIAAGFPFVNMFIWFVYQDDQGQPWESGIYTRSGAPKGTSPATVHRKRAAARCAKRPRARPSRHAHAAAQRLHPPLLRERHDRNADRDDVARVPRRDASSASGSRRAPLKHRLHDRRPRHASRAESRRASRYTATFAMNDRNGVVAEPPHHAPRRVVYASQTSTCIPSHH